VRAVLYKRLHGTKVKAKVRMPNDGALEPMTCARKVL